MEEIIRSIVDADKVARNQIQKKQEERRNIQNLIQDQSREIKTQYKAETERCLQELKKQLQMELELQKQEEDKLFEKTQQTLTDTYTEKRDVWVEEIVKRCLYAS